MFLIAGIERVAYKQIDLCAQKCIFGNDTNAWLAAQIDPCRSVPLRAPPDGSYSAPDFTVLRPTKSVRPPKNPTGAHQRRLESADERTSSGGELLRRAENGCRRAERGVERTDTGQSAMRPTRSGRYHKLRSQINLNFPYWSTCLYPTRSMPATFIKIALDGLNDNVSNKKILF